MIKEKWSSCGKFLIVFSGSIFTDRPGKFDVRIKKQDTWGGRRKEDGKLYNTSICKAAESGETLSHYSYVPQSVIDEAMVFARECIQQQQSAA
ncbi:hypothetical protein [Acidithiobacillus thiooxidans]|uniref:Uncharacterized protein n=2 Tax=Acidithiobacillus thiooxidans TaxID=930 RepID=A0A543Q2A3_ACITH|nr:hypothetical protein [Acidithiobacillus thiooxidans]MDX5935451.1 hypothetical protein [Acidithiobacillus thiooxidans]OCX69418.1 hypothetical protein A6O24_18510 [Acidithiobacillus thiooxidans]OCX72317.1 hypothetical protein A6P07_10145 [Acidithiobacillus thiooxidans]OCX79316.1 hypothetical protein A6O26_16890 [Acidithiobacillus thiooxidans]OCX86593.1 hypothetical protein A6M27_12245 [Acidithiobacillus thiooxidans]